MKLFLHKAVKKKFQWVLQLNLIIHFYEFWDTKAATLQYYSKDK